MDITETGVVDLIEQEVLNYRQGRISYTRMCEAIKNHMDWLDDFIKAEAAKMKNELVAEDFPLNRGYDA